MKQDKHIVKEIQKRYKFYTIDEYQDVNPIQEELIRLVSGKQNVCVVGDDDQSIYQWRGAIVENIIHFKKNYSTPHPSKIKYKKKAGIGDTPIRGNFTIATKTNPYGKIITFLTNHELNSKRIV